MSHNPFLTEDTSPEQKIIFKKGQILTVWRKPGCNTFGQTQRLSDTNQYLNDTATTTWHTIGEVYLSVAPCVDPHNDVANTAPEDVSAHCDERSYVAEWLDAALSSRCPGVRTLR